MSFTFRPTVQIATVSDWPTAPVYKISMDYELHCFDHAKTSLVNKVHQKDPTAMLVHQVELHQINTDQYGWVKK